MPVLTPFRCDSLLPTFVWQEHPELLDRASPNVVLRIWAGLNTSKSSQTKQLGVSDTDALVQDVLADSQSYAHIVGLKVPHFQFGVSARVDTCQLDGLAFSVLI